VGRVLNWNYVTACWSEFDYYNQYDSGSGAAHAAFCSGAAIDGQFCYVNAFGWVHRENTNLSLTNAYLDTGPSGNVWVTLSLETAWVKASGIQGWGRFWYARFRGAEGDAPHDITLSVGHDFSPTYTQSHTWTALEQTTFESPDIEIHIGIQKCASIRASISDAAPTGVASTTGSGPTLVGAHFEAGLYRKGKRLSPAQGA
jgi:hypothetical protein